MKYLLLLSFIFSLNIFTEPENDFYLECTYIKDGFDTVSERHVLFYSKDTKELKWHVMYRGGTKYTFHKTYPLEYSGESSYVFRSKKKYDRNRFWNESIDYQQKFYPNKRSSWQKKKKPIDMQYEAYVLDRKELTMRESTGAEWDKTHQCRKIWYWTYVWKTRNDGKPKEKEKPNRI